MKKVIYISFFQLLIVLNAYSSKIDTITFGPFGKTTICLPVGTPEAVVLFVSGDEGWSKGITDMAGKLAEEGALVARIDIQHYMKKLKSSKVKCYYPASDFENLSVVIQKKYKFKQYFKPVLVGYLSGATMVYGALAQAPANTFKGAIALNFCPQMNIDKPLCSGNGLTSKAIIEGSSYYLESTKKLTAPFIVLQGTDDKVCGYDEIKKYMENMPLGELMPLPDVGHGFSLTENSLPKILTAYNKIFKEPVYQDKAAEQNVKLQSEYNDLLKSDLPLTITPTSSKENLPLVFFISGDGGWSTFDHGVSDKLAVNGMPVVGLDSQKYFWNEKQPKETAEEVAKAVKFYLQLWKKSSFVIVGYSFGACVAPFIANNLPANVKENLKGVFCLSPDETCDFEIHVVDMLSISTKEKYDVLAEMKLISAFKPVCIFGSQEGAAVKSHFNLPGVKTEILPGGHHYNNDYTAVMAIIIKDYTR